MISLVGKLIFPKRSFPPSCLFLSIVGAVQTLLKWNEQLQVHYAIALSEAVSHLRPAQYVPY
jgi:hypothetical protein